MSCTVDRGALLKILLHSAKYPSSAINGLLLGTASGADDTGSVNVVDAVPLFHSFLTLHQHLRQRSFRCANCPSPVWYSPYTLEAVREYLGCNRWMHSARGSRGLQVVGYYHANESLKDTELKPFARRIADRIQQRCPAGSGAAGEQEDCQSLLCDTHPL